VTFVDERKKNRSSQNSMSSAPVRKVFYYSTATLDIVVLDLCV